MNKFIATAAAAFFALGTAAQAATISISTFDISTFNNKTGYSGFVVQDFEDIGAAFDGKDGIGTPGQLPGPLETNVGTFSAITEDENGFGSTCNASGGDCTQLFLNNTTVNGQGNMVPDGGVWSLNANDTFGILWDVVKNEGGSLFNRVVFGLMDAADQSGTSVTIDVMVTDEAGDTQILTGLNNAEQKLIVIDFAMLQSAATVEIRSSQLSDSFSIDGASVGVVPLPAGGLLLLTGLGALALRRRRKAA